MDLEDLDEDTDFILIFPYKFQTKYPKTDREISFCFLGQTLDVILEAKYIGVKHKKSGVHINRWLEDVKSYCVVGSVSPDENSNVYKTHYTPRSNGSTLKVIGLPYQEQEDLSKRYQWQQVDEKTLRVSLKIPLASLPDSCTRCCIWVAIWSDIVEQPEFRRVELLEDFLDSNPSDDVLKQDNKTLRQIVCKSLSVARPPTVSCRSRGVGGNYFFFTKITNSFEDDLVINSAYIISDVVRRDNSPCYQGDLNTRSIESEADINGSVQAVCRNTRWPLVLSSTEEHTLVFQALVSETEDSFGSLEVELILELTYVPSKEYGADEVVSHYRLPGLIISRQELVFTAEQESPPTSTRCSVNYKVTNNLQDFMSLKLLWSPEKALNDEKAKTSVDYARSIQKVMNSAICHEPNINLGPCKLGSTVSTTVDFHFLNTGVYELGKHMKLNLQYSIPSGSVLDSDRRGSVTSTRSMPIETKVVHRHSTLPAKSSSLSPLDSADKSNHVITRKTGSASCTPVQLSPAHTRTIRSVSHVMLASAANQAATTRSATTGTGQKHYTTTGPVLANQVLKRNFQVYVLK